MKLTPFALTLSQHFIPSGFEDPKVQSFFRKYPKKPGNPKLRTFNIPLTDAQLDAYLEKIEGNLRDQMHSALKEPDIPRTKERINALLGLVRKSDLLPVVTELENEVFQLGSLLVDKARSMTKAYAEDTAKTFRKVPSSENYFNWLAANKMTDAIGADLPDNFAPPFTILNNKPYSVVSGDWLSKIALRFYGHANLWDIIWEANGMNFHPDRIIPHQKLILP